MKSYGHKHLFSLILLLGFAGQVSAGVMVKADFTGTSSQGNSRKTVAFTSASNGSGNVIADELKWKVVNESGNSEFTMGSLFNTFCIEVDRYLADPSDFTVYTASNVLDSVIAPAKTNLLTGLVSNFLASPDGVFDTSLKTAAFQIATWEILYETATTLDTETGTFQITNNSDVRSLANSWLAGLNSSTTYSLAGYELRFLHNESGQDQFMFIPTASASLSFAPVPEPAALAVWASFALGLAGTAVRRRRRNWAGHGPVCGDLESH